MASHDYPRSLKCKEEQASRREMLSQPHISPLTKYVIGLRKVFGNGWYVPDFDPMDGGIEAQILFLFEKPGTMTDPNGKHNGSGFISRNNDDPTAEHTFAFMNFAGLGGKWRKLTCSWNIAPAWNGTTDIFAKEVKSGIPHVRTLLTQFPSLRVVVLVGEKAKAAEPNIRSSYPALHILHSCHPSVQVKNSDPERWSTIWCDWQKAKLLLKSRKKRDSSASVTK